MIVPSCSGNGMVSGLLIRLGRNFKNGFADVHAGDGIVEHGIIFGLSWSVTIKSIPNGFFARQKLEFKAEIHVTRAWDGSQSADVCAIRGFLYGKTITEKVHAIVRNDEIF